MEVIKKNKKTVLMQDETGFQFYVPREIYEDEEKGTQDYVDNSIPHSLSIDLILQDVIDTEAVAQDFYTHGIHTLDDILANRKKANDIVKKHISAETIIRAVVRG